MMKKAKWMKIVSFILAVGIVAGVATIAFASGGAEGAHGGGGIPREKWMDLLWRTLNFAGLAVILFVALKKPIVNGLSSRRQSIAEQFEDLEAQKAEAERKYKEYEAKLSKIDGEVESIISAAVKQGEAERERIVEDANRAAGDIQRQAEMAVLHELAEAKIQLRSEIAEQAVIMAEELIKKNLQAADQNKLVDDYLDKVGAIQ